MQDFAAYEQLRELLSAPSAETRYGAFRALWAMNDNDPLVKGEVLGGQFHYHVLDVAGPPMIHVTRNRLAEIVAVRPGPAVADAAGPQRRQRDHGHQPRRRRNLREQVFRRRRRPEADRLDAGGRRDPRDRRTGRNLSRRGPGPARGQELRRACRRGSRSTPCPRPAGPTTGSPRASTTEADQSGQRSRRRPAGQGHSGQPVARTVLPRERTEAALQRGLPTASPTKNRPTTTIPRRNPTPKKGFFARMLGR